jgi:hypothetical protein
MKQEAKLAEILHMHLALSCCSFNESQERNREMSHKNMQLPDNVHLCDTFDSDNIDDLGLENPEPHSLQSSLTPSSFHLFEPPRRST